MLLYAIEEKNVLKKYKLTFLLQTKTINEIMKTQLTCSSWMDGNQNVRSINFALFIFIGRTDEKLKINIHLTFEMGI